MSGRDELIADFLKIQGWADGTVLPLAGDASNRRYLRVVRGDDAQSAVIMDAAPEAGENVAPFIFIAHYLRQKGLSAPEIRAADDKNGILLLEDLGNDLYARVLERAPDQEQVLYTAATDVLFELHEKEPPELDPYSPQLMGEYAALAMDWYVAALRGPDTGGSAELQALVQDAVSRLAPDMKVLVQRDYHAENLIWLPQRKGCEMVGLLDFQDAMLGHRAYDLVSLLQDARRDVSPEVQAGMIEHYLKKSGLDRAEFITAYNCLGAQRNLRIIGVFARLCIRDGKSHYLDLMPRVWQHLMTDLKHPALMPLAQFVEQEIPAPTPKIIETLRQKCVTHPAH